MLVHRALLEYPDQIAVKSHAVWSMSLPYLNHLKEMFLLWRLREALMSMGMTLMGNLFFVHTCTFKSCFITVHGLCGHVEEHSFTNIQGPDQVYYVSTILSQVLSFAYPLKCVLVYISLIEL